MLSWTKASGNTSPLSSSYCIVAKIIPALVSSSLSLVSGTSLLPSLGVISNLQSLFCLSRHPRYRVSPFSSISAPTSSSHNLHPASTSSAPDKILWGRLRTVYPTLADGGSLFILSSRVFVVVMGTLDGVSNNLFGSCISATSASASSSRHVKDAAVSKRAVRRLLFGGGAQPRGPCS